jgi:hypothetical protein
MASSALALRGKNLANALSLTFQTVDPQIGQQAYALADYILKDPVLSDSLFAPKTCTVNDPLAGATATAEKAPPPGPGARAPSRGNSWPLVRCT